MIKDILREAAERMQSALDTLEDDLSGIRTGRASPALVERSPSGLLRLQHPLDPACFDQCA